MTVGHISGVAADARLLVRRRLEAADVRGFTAAGAGERRRAAIAGLVREHMRRAWAQAAGGRRPDGLALAAVGSLARQDCGPLSDFDLVLLHDGRHDSGRLTELADRLWYPLWDAGLRLDHSTRSLTECRQVASDDLAAAVGMLDISHVCGDEMLVAAVRSTILRDWRASARTRLPEVTAAMALRHRRFGDLPDLLEPDLKEARGGLRDMRLLSALVAAWLTDRPHGEVDRACATILDVRDALQVVTGRSRDKLLRDDHDGVAALLGFGDTDHMLVHLAEAGRVIAHSLDATLRRASQSHRARSLRRGPRAPQLTPLGHGLFVNDGEVVLGPRVEPGSDPLLLLRAAESAARAGLVLSPTTLTNLTQRGAPLPRPWPQAARETFGDLLATGEGMWQVWESLTLAGATETWIPQWNSVRSLPQHNPVHRHTVDRHLVQTVIEASSLLDRVRRPEALLLAALLHDLGKAREGVDHARAGVAPTRDWMTAVGYEHELVDLVCRLVEQHLTLAELATRRDPDDPRTVDELEEAVDGDRDTLDLLAALTEADARAVGPQIWSTWRAALVADLVGRAEAQLAGGEFGESAARTGAGAAMGIDTRARQGVPEHVRAAASATGVLVHVEDSGDDQVVSIVAPDRVGLFADCAGVLAAHGLSVRRATLTTHERMAVDRWHVTSRARARADAEHLERALRRLAKGDNGPLLPLRRTRTGSAGARPPAPAVQRVVTRALLLRDASSDATVLELRAPDRPGLLYDIGRHLAGLGVSVRSAHVSTSCGQAVDTLYLSDADGSRLTPPRVAAVISALMEAGE